MVEAALSPVPRRAGLVAVWVLLGVLAVGIAALEWTDRLRANSGGPGADPRLLLPVPLSELGAIEIADAGGCTASSAMRPARWFYHGAHGVAEGAHTHEPDPARSERIAHALAALGRARVERDFRSDATAAPPTVLPLPSWSSSSTAPASRSRSCSTPSAISRLTR